ncbi:hypothetical protein HanIR_Chr16g0789961 [Helianthus annuus]|nr:hypothetical protein HanIR_Chr16g0789961 [Helianthus annuus]
MIFIVVKKRLKCIYTFYKRSFYCVLAPTNEVLDSINKELLENLYGEEKIYFSSYSLLPI